MTVHGGNEQRRGAVIHRQACIDAWHREQPLHHRVVTVLGGGQKRSCAVLHRLVHIDAL